ncbi:DUF1559 domain-containing protein [soil metagenome]
MKMKAYALNDSLKIELRNGAFTLVELLITIGIIGVLAALLFPALKRGTESANKAKCSSNLRQLGIAVHSYVSEHDGWMPPMRYPYNYTWWPDAISAYLTDKPWKQSIETTSAVFHCPSGSKDWPYKGTSIEIAGVNYAYNARIGYIVNGDPTGTSTVAVPLSPSYRLRKLAGCKYATKTGLIMDGDSQSIQFEYDAKADINPVTLRHNRRANVLFIDGHVETVDFNMMSLDDLKKMSLSAPYNDEWP